MQTPKNIRITNVAGKPTAFLSPKSDGLKECYADTRLNGESTLEFLLHANSEKVKELAPECEIWAGGRVYNLRKDDAIDTIRDDKNVLWTKVMAVERWSELDSSYIEPSISNDLLLVPLLTWLLLSLVVAPILLAADTLLVMPATPYMLYYKALVGL